MRTQQSCWSLAGALLLGMSLGCQPQDSAPQELEVQNVATRPLPPDRDFVGSAACQECHEAIVEKYRTHPMRLASGAATERSAEDFPEGQFETAAGWHYAIEHSDQGLFHSERLLDGDTLVYEDRQPISHFIGANVHSQAFVVERDEELYQSPVQLHADGAYDLVDGYELLNQHFGRSIDSQCVACHMSNVQTASAGQAPTDHPRNSDIQEFGISCERCHGPAAKHVAFHRSSESGQPEKDPIQRIAALEVDQQMAICSQCHLWDAETVLRYGREAFDFRPGDHVGDVEVAFIPTQTEKETLVSQVNQLQQSACFQNSQGALQCTTCHDPHSATATPMSYREKCVECHHEQTTDCSIPVAQQGDCVSCHMPPLSGAGLMHASRTQHRILRPTAKPPAAPQVEFTFRPYEPLSPSVDAAAMERARNLVLAQVAREDHDVLAAFVASRAMTELQTLFPNDRPMLLERSRLYRITNDEQQAINIIDALLVKNPQDAGALRELVLIAFETEVFDRGIQHGLAYLAMQPWDNEITGRVVYMLGRANRIAEGIALAEQAITRFPWDPQYASWLSQAFQAKGDQAEAARYEKLAQQLRVTQPER